MNLLIVMVKLATAVALLAEALRSNHTKVSEDSQV